MILFTTQHLCACVCACATDQEITPQMSPSNGFFKASSSGSGDGLSRSFSESLMPRKSAILPTKVINPRTIIHILLPDGTLEPAWTHRCISRTGRCNHSSLVRSCNLLCHFSIPTRLASNSRMHSWRGAPCSRNNWNLGKHFRRIEFTGVLLDWRTTGYDIRVLPSGAGWYQVNQALWNRQRTANI